MAEPLHQKFDWAMERLLESEDTTTLVELDYYQLSALKRLLNQDAFARTQLVQSVKDQNAYRKSLRNGRESSS